MPSRREFLGGMVGAAVMGGCQGGRLGGCQPARPGEGRPARDRPGKERPAEEKPGEEKPGEEKPEGAGPPGEGGAEDKSREQIRPPASFPRADALKGIRQIKPPGADMVVATGTDPARMLALAMDAFGGFAQVVGKGDRVALSPNFSLSRPEGTGVCTNPLLVRAVIQSCFAAGAAEVVCIDHAYDPSPRAFHINGGCRAVAGTGARLLNPWSAEQHVQVLDFEQGPVHQSKVQWQAVPAALLRCDALITIPIFKHHRETRVTGAVKKTMGLVWRRRIYHEVGLDACIAELASILRPTLVIMDAMKFLTSNGPDGPGETTEENSLLVTTDPLLADSYACRWLDVLPPVVKHLDLASELRVGQIDASKARIEQVTM